MSQGAGQPPYGYGSSYENAYRPPAGGYPTPGPGSPPGPPMGGEPGDWTPSEAIGFGWKAVTGDFVRVGLPLALLMLVMAAASGIVGGVFGAITTVVQSAARRELGPNPVALLPITILTMLVQNLVSLSIQAFFTGGLASFCLKLLRGMKPDMGTAFEGYRYFLPMLIGQALVFVLVLAGMVLCIVPGVIVALGLMFWTYALVDRGAGAMDALKESWRLTRGQKGSLFVFGLLSFGLVLLGMLACCVGLFVAGPVISLAMGYIYLRLRGERPTLAAL